MSWFLVLFLTSQDSPAPKLLPQHPHHHSGWWRSPGVNIGVVRNEVLIPIGKTPMGRNWYTSDFNPQLEKMQLEPQWQEIRLDRYMIHSRFQSLKRCAKLRMNSLDFVEPKIQVAVWLTKKREMSLSLHWCETHPKFISKPGGNWGTKESHPQLVISI